MWVVSLAFASFLIGLGGKIVADLPRLEDRLRIEDFVEPRGALPPLRAEIEGSESRQREQGALQQQARLALTAARNAARGGQAAHNAWVSTRHATTDVAQDAELLKRTRDLDALKAREREAETAVERIDKQQLDIAQSIDRLRDRENILLRDAQAAFQSA